MPKSPAPVAPLLTNDDLLALWTKLAPAIGPGPRSLTLLFLDHEARPRPMLFPMDGMPDRPDPMLIQSLSHIIGELVADDTAASVVMLLSRQGGSTITAQDTRWAAALRDLSDWPIHLATRDGIQPIGQDSLAAAS